MKIGILTYHRARNYGAFLQSVALCSRLNAEKDIDAEIIDFDMEKAQKAYAVKLWPLRKLYHFKTYFFDLKMKAAFERGYDKTKSIRSASSLVSDDLKEFQEFVKDKYDVIIAGSDEIWNVKFFRGFPTPYFLIGDLGCRKLSYAASARVDYNMLDEDNHNLLNNALKDFEFISVRDSLTYTEVAKEGVDKHKMMISCDPSFLYDFDVKSRKVGEIVKNRKIDENKKTVLVICENKVVLRSICKELNQEYNLMAVAVRANGYICVPDIDPFEWMELIKSVDFVITSFFHGVCFSIINNTSFVAIATSDSRRTKLFELLQGTTLENHLIDFSNNSTFSWRELIISFSNKEDFRAFVMHQRVGFDQYLRRLRKEYE